MTEIRRKIVTIKNRNPDGSYQWAYSKREGRRAMGEWGNAWEFNHNEVPPGTVVEIVRTEIDWRFQYRKVNA